MQLMFSRGPAARCSLMLLLRVVKLSVLDRAKRVQGYYALPLSTRSPSGGMMLILSRPNARRSTVSLYKQAKADRYESGHQGTEATCQDTVGHSAHGFTVRR